MYRTGYSSDDPRGVDERENACPPVAYISDLIRVSPHVFQLVEKWSPERNNNHRTEQKDTHRQKCTKHKQRASHGPTLSPEKKDKITAAFQSDAVSPFPPGSNCSFSSLVVLCLRFAGVAAVPARVPTHSVGEEMSAVVVENLVPARVFTRSVSEEMFSPWFDPMPMSK